MKIVAFDTETTGRSPGNICQISYIMDENGLIQAKNKYFKVSYIEPGAQRVHGLTVEKLETLSGGLGFADFADEILRDFESCGCWIAHNIDFDKNFLLTEFRRLNVTPHMENQFCTMKYFTPICKLPQTGKQSSADGYKYPRLDELIEFFGFSEDEVFSRAATIFNISDSKNYHDARVDTTAVYMCYKKALEMGLVK